MSNEPKPRELTKEEVEEAKKDGLDEAQEASGGSEGESTEDARGVIEGGKTGGK